MLPAAVVPTVHAPNPSFEPRIELGPKIAFAVVNRLVGLVPRLFTSLIAYPAQLLRDRLCLGRAAKILGDANWGVDDLRGVITLPWSVIAVRLGIDA